MDFREPVPTPTRKQAYMAGILVAGIMLGAGLMYIAQGYGNLSGEAAAQNVISTLEKQSGQQFQLVNVEKQSGLYRVELRDSNDRLRTYFVTKNGRYYGNMNNLLEANLRATVRNRLASCMANRSVVLFGNISQQQTRQQIQVLGGTRRVSPIYTDVNNPRVLRQARQLGVRQVPSLYYNGSTLSGVNSLDRIQQFTGCRIVGR